MSLKAKRMAVSKTTKIVLKGNRGVENNVHYRGVQMRDSGRYYAQIKDLLKQTRVWPGTFDTSVEAAKAYDAAAIMFRGMKALMNFPIPASSVNIPPRKNSFVDSVNGMLAVVSPLPLALSFRTSYSFSSLVSPPIV